MPGYETLFHIQIQPPLKPSSCRSFSRVSNVTFSWHHHQHFLPPSRKGERRRREVVGRYEKATEKKGKSFIFHRKTYAVGIHVPWKYKYLKKMLNRLHFKKLTSQSLCGKSLTLLAQMKRKAGWLLCTVYMYVYWSAVVPSNFIITMFGIHSILAQYYTSVTVLALVDNWWLHEDIMLVVYMYVLYVINVFLDPFRRRWL